MRWPQRLPQYGRPTELGQLVEKLVAESHTLGAEFWTENMAHDVPLPAQTVEGENRVFHKRKAAVEQSARSAGGAGSAGGGRSRDTPDRGGVWIGGRGAYTTCQNIPEVTRRG
jgi:hypothetical protein